MKQAIPGVDGGKAAVRFLNGVPKPRMVAKPPKKYVKRVNPRRAAIRKARDFGDVGEWVRTLPCASPRSPHLGPTEAAHVRSRGAGGRAQNNVLPLCTGHHTLQHTLGWELIGLTKEKAKQLAVEYQELFERTFATSDETGDDTK